MGIIEKLFSSESKLKIAIIIFFIVSILAVFVQVVNHEFVDYDDAGYVFGDDSVTVFARS